jgi:hypothetical protein
MPTESMWLGNESSNTSLLKIAKQLLEKQLDFDFVDAQGIGSVFTLEKGTFKNLSGQTYSTIIIPSLTIINEKVLERLQAFAKSGGTVIFLGTEPSLIAGKTFLDAKTSTSLGWAVRYGNDSLTSGIVKKITADVVLSNANPSIKYLHRKWKDADLYFFFNEANENSRTNATINGNGKAEIWDASADILPLNGEVNKNGKINFPLELNAHETKFIIIKN